MHGGRRHVHGLAWAHFGADELAIDFPLEQDAARPHEDRLILLVVVLQAEGVTLVDVDLLADIAVGAGPPQLVSPWFLDAM